MQLLGVSLADAQSCSDAKSNQPSLQVFGVE